MEKNPLCAIELLSNVNKIHINGVFLQKQVDGGSRFEDVRPPTLTASEDQMVLRQRATRALFSPARPPASNRTSSRKSASFLESLDLASKQDGDASAQHDTLYLK